MRTTLPALIALLLLVASPAPAFEEPDGFRGVKWGATREELRVHLQRAGDTVKCYPLVGCASPIMIGPVPTQASYLFAPDADAFEAVLLAFAPTQYTALRAIFTERYGAPSNVQATELQNRMGAKYTNETTIWGRPDDVVIVSLSRYGSTLDKGRAWIGLKASLDRQTEKTKEALKKGKDDL